jgi:hypothetical protein
MTREQWEKMTAREKDALVAEKVMGVKVDCPTCMVAELGCIGTPTYPACYEGKGKCHYSSDISAAFQVVEKMRERGIMLTLMNWHYYGRNYWTAKFRNSDADNKEWEGEGDTAPSAISLAALLALSPSPR